MDAERALRWLFVLITLATFSLSAFFRRRARQSSETIPRLREGRAVLLLRMLFAAPLYLSFLAYMLNPAWMAWSSFPLPMPVRWAGALAGLAALPLLYWVLASLGRNISETVLTKAEHQLVTAGPYRWVRHPLYAVATLIFISLGVMAANWFFLGMAAVIIAAMVAFVIPREEAELTAKFGEAYRRYRQRTGMLFPRIGGPGAEPD